ncbi:hypothetical protein HDU85_000212 [Gaertneriomyces sp. JEL0708]|nr:hypothetical protein HDU85_000212 [Gaertneriomyces sp. JEL0708]
MPSEEEIKDFLVANPPKDFPRFIAREWERVKGRSDQGKCDLVFADYRGTKYLVVEVKSLHSGTGKTAQVARSKARKKVKYQIKKYVDAWAKKHPGVPVYGRTNLDDHYGLAIGPVTVQPLKVEPIEVERSGTSTTTKLLFGAAGVGLAAALTLFSFSPDRPADDSDDEDE